MHNHCIPFQRKCYNKKKREWINTCFSVPVDFLCVSLKTKIIKPVKWNSYPLKFSVLALLKKKLEFKITNKNEHKCSFKTVIVIFSKVQCFKILYIFWVMEKGLNENFKQEFNPSEQVFKKNIIVIFLNQGSRNITLPRLLF